MKKLFRTVLAVAVAAAAMTSCQKAVMEEEGGINAVVSFQASFPETKTTFGTAEAGKYPVLWQDGDKVAVSVSLTNPLKDLEVTPSTDKKTGTFSKDVTLPGEGPWAFYVVSPSAAIVGANSGYKSLTLDFATDQTPTAVSVDPAAQVLLAMATATTIPTEPVPVTFNHLAAYGKVSLSNLPTSAKVTGLSLAFDQPVTGRWYFYPEEEDVTKRFKENAASNLVNLTTEKTADIFFAVAPNGVAVKSVKVTLKTEDGNYEKEVTVPEKTFKSGVVSAFTVDMTGASKVQDKVFKLVKNVANLAAGDQVIIANKAATSAISTTQQGNNRKGAAITPDANGDIVNPSAAVQILTVAEGVTTGTFAFSPEAGMYLYAVKGSNKLLTKDALEADGSFTVAIADDGEATVTCKFEGEDRILMHNSSSDLFACYKANQKPIAIYKMESTTPPAPKVVDIWVNDAAGSQPVDGGAEAKSDDWLSYSGGTATWTANTTNAPRTKTLELADGAKITVTQLEDKDFKGTYDFTSKIFCTDGFTTAGDKKTITGVAFGEPLLGETLKDGNNVEHKNVIGIDGLYHAGIIADAAVDIDYEAKSVKLGVFLDGRKAQKDATLTGDYQYVAFLPGVCASSSAGSFAKPWTFCNPDLGTPDYEWLWFETEDLETFTYSCAKVAQKLSTTGYSSTPYILGICVNVFKAEDATSTNAKGNYNVVYQFNTNNGNVGLQFKKTGPYVPKADPDPTHIDTAEKLVAFLKAATAETTTDYIMTKDVDMKNVTVPTAAGFKGTFDGKGKTIKNLAATAPLFATLDGTVKNVTLEGTFTGTGDGKAALFAPVGENKGTLDGVTNKATVSYSIENGTEPILVAGVVAFSTGVVNKCTNAGTVTFTSANGIMGGGVAGVAGYQAAAMTSCKNTGNISSVSLYTNGKAAKVEGVAFTEALAPTNAALPTAAGVVGFGGEGFSMTDCHNEGAVSFSQTKIESFPTKGSVNMNRHQIAGVVSNPWGAIEGCTNKGAVTASVVTSDGTAMSGTKCEYICCVGGIAGGDYFATGQNVSGLKGCSNSGTVKLISDSAQSNSVVGGIIGWPGVEGAQDTKTEGCTNSGEIVLQGTVKARIGGVQGGTGNMVGCTNTGNVHVISANATSVAGLLCGFHSQGHVIENCVAQGTLTGDVKLDGVGGLMGNIGNAAHTTGAGCAANCTIVCTDDTANKGIIVGKYNGKTKQINLGTDEAPIKVKGTLAGTVLTAENFTTLLEGPANADASKHVIKAVFGE